VKPILVGLALAVSAVAGAPQPTAQHLRSRITIYDLRAKTSRVVFTADAVWEAPNWSRDGKFLLANSGGNLYRLPLDGGEPLKPQKLDLPPGLECNNDHDLTRDGTALAISCSSPGSRASQVYTAAADGRDARLMTPSTEASYFHGWSPDGRWLAFVGRREGKFSLFRVPAAGGAEQRLTARGGYDDGPEYSPDGKWIYFNSNRSGGWDIWRMPPDGAGPDDRNAERITSDDGEDWFPHFSPDGKRIVFLSFPKGTATHNARMKGVSLRLMPAPGKRGEAPKIETLLTIFGGQGSINVNSWSPDSRKFAFVEYEPL
jgi:TolB protein